MPSSGHEHHNRKLSNKSRHGRIWCLKNNGFKACLARGTNITIANFQTMHLLPRPWIMKLVFKQMNLTIVGRRTGGWCPDILILCSANIPKCNKTLAVVKIIASSAKEPLVLSATDVNPNNSHVVAIGSQCAQKLVCIRSDALKPMSLRRVWLRARTWQPQTIKQISARTDLML